ncbi:MAG: InlB B-repeat-containing protein [Oscillospiraceae bacterium]|nr:InlB B-repeat-containing protein [Oscillospiraceae bacterium]
MATYTVSYNANGGSGAPGAQTKTHGVALTLSAMKPTKASTTATGSKVTFNANGGTTAKGEETATDTTAYTFSSWNTAANGGGTSYASGGSYTANASATLYAQYSAETTKGAVTLPTAEECQRAGYELLGFAASASAEEAAYAPGASYTASAAVTLYAVWAALGLAFIDSGTGFEPYQVWIDNGSSWEQYAPYVDNGTSWEEMS